MSLFKTYRKTYQQFWNFTNRKCWGPGTADDIFTAVESLNSDFTFLFWTFVWFILLLSYLSNGSKQHYRQIESQQKPGSDIIISKLNQISQNSSTYEGLGTIIANSFSHIAYLAPAGKDMKLTWKQKKIIKLSVKTCWMTSSHVC